MTKLVLYLDSIEQKMELVPVEAERFWLLFEFLHQYLQDAVVWRETLVTTRTKLEEVAYFFKSTVPLPPGIMIWRPGIAGHGEAPHHKTSMHNHAATTVPTEGATYQNQGTKRTYNVHNSSGSAALKRPIWPENVLCFKCGNKGHIKKKCTLPRKKRNWALEQGRTSGTELEKAQGHWI